MQAKGSLKMPWGEDQLEVKAMTWDPAHRRVRARLKEAI